MSDAWKNRLREAEMTSKVKCSNKRDATMLNLLETIFVIIQSILLYNEIF